MIRKCELCGESFSTYITIDRKRRNMCNRRYCLKCSPFQKHNTRKLNKKNDVTQGEETICSVCHRHYIYDRISGHRKTTCNSCNVHKCQRKKKAFAVKEFGGKCVKCGYDKCVGALDFHHNGEKDENSSYVILRWSWERAKKELEKCQLLCSNCHRELHYQEDNLSS